MTTKPLTRRDLAGVTVHASIHDALAAMTKTMVQHHKRAIVKQLKDKVKRGK